MSNISPEHVAVDVFLHAVVRPGACAATSERNKPASGNGFVFRVSGQTCSNGDRFRGMMWGSA